MTRDGSQSPCGKPTLIGKIGPWLLIIPSALAGILLVELFCGLFFQSLGNLPGRDRRVVFFDGRQPIFENHDRIFGYTPHNEIRQIIAFFTQDDFFTEFDYRYRTNNYGFVQDSDIVPGQDSLILLGDSFTEGQGAEPWFRQVSPVIDKLGYQPINGGVLGTGFQQWLRLDRYLVSNNIQLRKAVILFISDDYHRPVWDLPAATLTCLSSLSSCHADESYFYRLPGPQEMSSWIAKVRTARQPPRMHLRLKPSALLPASYGVYSRLRQQILFSNAERGSRAAISQLISIYGAKNIVFIHLPQKDEIDTGPSDLGLRARRAIEDAGGKVLDGFKLCHMTAADYYPHDEHPNQSGYGKIAACATDVINQLVTGGRQED